MDQKLQKHERLYLRSDINSLFRYGRYVFGGGFKCCYRQSNGEGYNRIMISVPKRLFKRAVKRNLLKRRIREAYRRNKALLPVADEGCDILIIYISKDVRTTESIETGIRELFTKISGIVSSPEAEKTDEEGIVVPADPLG